MAGEIHASDVGPELAYHLGKNPDVAAEISLLPERDAIRRMAFLEVELKAEKAKAKPNTVSGAPPPPPKIPAGDAKIEKNPSDMTDAEFSKWRRRQIAQRH
jgi:hypothetical protein